MKKEQETTRETEREQDRLEVIEMPIKITKVPAILAPTYDHLLGQYSEEKFIKLS